MLLTTVREEFTFHCQCRNLSPKTVKNYGKQIDYLVQYLAQEKGIAHIQDVEPRHVKSFLLQMKPNHSPNYLNDLLKAYKVFFRYAYNEGYTRALVTEKIQNVKAPKVIIRTFTESELKRMCNYYQGYDFLSIRNKVILLLLVDTGIRLSELINLTEEQLKYLVTSLDRRSTSLISDRSYLPHRQGKWLQCGCQFKLFRLNFYPKLKI